MAICRRTVNRKRRCLILVVTILLLLFVSITWKYHQADILSPLESIPFKNKTSPQLFIPPKYNVLLEPPKPPTPHAPLSNKKEHEDVVMAVDHKDDGVDTKIIVTTKAPSIIRKLEDTAEKNPKVVSEHSKPAVNESVKMEIDKSKMLAQMGVLGNKGDTELKRKVYFAENKWNLSISFEDIGNVMKDTSFFNNLKPLDLQGPLLTSTKNRTANFSLSMPIKMGYCDCWEHYCVCCVQLMNKRLHLNTTACTNFTFISKSHELDVTYKLGGVKVHKQIISADAPPLLCMGSIPKVADLCVHFSNMTYRVDRIGMHKSQLLGCTDFSLNVYNKTVNALPVDCFQIPGDPNHHPKHEQIILPNFVP